MMGAVRGLCSMATRALLAELAPAHGVTMAAAGGIEAASRVRGGEAVDLVVLADAAMRALAAEGHLAADSLVPIVRSAIAVAVRAGEAIPDLADAAALRAALLAAPRIGYSTGPSGGHLLRLIGTLGLEAALAGRLRQAPPGIPVGRLLAEGAVDLGFQQRSELLGLPGIVIAGALPPGLAADTVFTAGLAGGVEGGEAAGRFITFLASPRTAAAKRRHGLEPA